MNDDKAARLGIGGNQGPPLLLLGETLREQLVDAGADLLRRKNELVAAAARMPAITDEISAAMVTDFIRQLSAAAKAADGRRIAAKEPYLEGGRGVDGFFQAIMHPLVTAKKDAEARLGAYMREKEAKARRAREIAAQLEREAAEAKRREAERQAAEIANARSLDDAIAAERNAQIAEAQATKAQKEAEVKPAELSRVRGEFGGLGSLRTQWTFNGIDRDKLNLEELRYHFPQDGLERAIRSFIKAGGRELAGTEIYETHQAVVR